MSRVLVPCHVKGTVALQVGDVRTSQGRPGVLVIDVTFPNVAPFQVSQPLGRDRGSWAGLSWLHRAWGWPRPGAGVTHLFIPSVNTLTRRQLPLHHLSARPGQLWRGRAKVAGEVLGIQL